MKKIIFAVCMIEILLSSVIVSGKSAYVYQGGMIFQSFVVCVMLIFLADENLGIGKFFEKPIFSWIGKHSYGIFLWQYPIFFLFSYRGWNNSAAILFFEIVLIILLTLWTESVTNFFLGKNFLSFGSDLMTLIKKTCLITTIFIGMIFMGFGFKGVASSAEIKTDAAELKLALEKKSAELEEKNQQAKVEIQEVQKVSAAAQTASTVPEVDLNGVVIIGDSITLASSTELRQFLPNCYIDAAISRRIYDGLQAIENFDAQGILGNIVVVSLGTNGTIEEFGYFKEDAEKILDYLGTDRKIFFVNIYYTPYSPYQEWLRTNHEYLKNLESTHENVFVVDWYSAISQHPEQIISDGIHPTQAGSETYAKVIRDKIFEVLSSER